MSGQLIKLTIDKRFIATLTLNRPEVHNAVSLEMIREMRKIIAELNSNPEPRGVILTGEGKTFCAGMDLRWMQKISTQNTPYSQGLPKWLIPLGGIIGLIVIKIFNLSGFPAGVLLIQSSMPSAILCYLVASMYSPKEIVDNISSTIVVSTLMSLITVPITVFFALKYFN